MLVNVADENDGHAVPVRAGRRYHGDMVTVRKLPLVRMTLSEFLEWEPRDPAVRAWQLLDGEPAAVAPTGQTHGAIKVESGAWLRNRLAEGGPTAQVVFNPAAPLQSIYRTTVLVTA
jgi:hypothetical protein